VVARSVFKDQDQWPLVLGAFIISSGVAYAAIGLIGWTLAVVFVLVMLAHATSGANWVLATVLLQKRTEDRYRGRVFATEWLLVMLADTVSILAASALQETGLFDLRQCFRVFAVLQILCGVLWIVFIVPKEREEAVAT
jgi:hypothetical protein